MKGGTGDTIWRILSMSSDSVLFWSGCVSQVGQTQGESCRIWVTYHDPFP